MNSAVPSTSCSHRTARAAKSKCRLSEGKARRPPQTEACSAETFVQSFRDSAARREPGGKQTSCTTQGGHLRVTITGRRTTTVANSALPAHEARYYGILDGVGMS